MTIILKQLNDFYSLFACQIPIYRPKQRWMLVWSWCKFGATLYRAILTISNGVAITWGDTFLYLRTYGCVCRSQKKSTIRKTQASFVFEAGLCLSLLHRVRTEQRRQNRLDQSYPSLGVFLFWMLCAEGVRKWVLRDRHGGGDPEKLPIRPIKGAVIIVAHLYRCLRGRNTLAN